MATAHEVRIGCSGWNYDAWREEIYPPGLAKPRWLSHYGGLFDTVEINNTFYRLPNVQTARRWAEETPPGFVFACKASRYLTHVKRLAEPEEGVERFYERLEPLREAGKLGPILWQLPANFKRNDERLAGVLELSAGRRHGFEFQHPSWYDDDVYDLLAEYDAALVIAEGPEREYDQHAFTASWTVLRLNHGRHGNFSAAELRGWREAIDDWRTQVDVYAYFNNGQGAFAPQDALRLAAATGSTASGGEGIGPREPAAPPATRESEAPED